MTVHQLTADPDTTTSETLDDLLEAGILYDEDQFTCNSYLVTGERNVLVDVGTLPGIADAVREHVDEPDAVVVTHQHGDHVERIDEVLDAFDAPLFSYADHPRRAEALEDGDILTMGDEMFEAVYTPGHAEDHVALVSESTVFSGDLVVPNDEAFDYASFGATGGPGPARERLIESLRRLLDRLPDGVEHLYAGHGDAYHGDVRKLVEDALERAEEREPKY